MSKSSFYTRFVLLVLLALFFPRVGGPVVWAFCTMAALPPITPAHVLVVGGGLAGLSAALSAAEHGARVTLLEKEVSHQPRIDQVRAPVSTCFLVVTRFFFAAVSLFGFAEVCRRQQREGYLGHQRRVHGGASCSWD